MKKLILAACALALIPMAAFGQSTSVVTGTGDNIVKGRPAFWTDNAARIAKALTGSGTGTVAPGMYVVLADGSGTTRIINATGSAITISTTTGTAGNFTFSAHPKLESIAGLTLTSGMALVATGSNTFTGTNKIAFSGTATYAVTSGTATYAGLGLVSGAALIVSKIDNYIGTDDDSGDALHIAHADTAQIGAASGSVLAVDNNSGYVQSDNGGELSAHNADFAAIAGAAANGSTSGLSLVVNDGGTARDDGGGGVSVDLATHAQNGQNSGQVLAVNDGSNYVMDDQGNYLDSHYADEAGLAASATSAVAAEQGAVSGNQVATVDNTGYASGDNGDPIIVNGSYYIVDADNIATPAASYSTSGGWVGPGIAGGSASTLVGVEFGSSQYVMKNNSSITEMVNDTATLVSGSKTLVNAAITANSGVTANIKTLAGTGQTPYLIQAFSGSATIKGAATDTSTLTVIITVIP